MLGEDDHQDPQLLAEKVDRLWALHGSNFSTVVSLEAVHPVQIAAVAVQGGRQGGLFQN